MQFLFFFGVYYFLFFFYLSHFFTRAFFLTDLFHCSTSTEEELKHKIAQSLKKVIKKSFYLKKCVVMERVREREKKNRFECGGKEIINNSIQTNAHAVFYLSKLIV